MKKITKFLLKNIELVVAFTLGIIIAGTSVYAAIVLASGEVSYNNTSSGLTSTNVQDALDELYTKASTCPNNLAPVNIGNYISLTPTKTSYTITTSLTGYTSDQTINPSELNLWRVINIHKDGSFDVVSEYVSSTDVNFKGTTGYANYVGALNTIAAQYQVAGKTIGSRHMGYGGQTEIIGDTSAFDGSTNTAPSTTTTPNPTTGTGQEYNGGVLGDTLYLKDYLLVGNVYKSDTSTYGTTGLKAYKVGTTTATDYRLASRKFTYNSATSFLFEARIVTNGGNLNYANYLRRFINGWRDYDLGVAVRPILTLKSGITISGGAGTKANPYTLS